MTEQEFDALRRTYDLVSEQSLEMLRKDLSATIEYLSLILDKPSDMRLSISIDNEEQEATLEQYRLNKAVSGYENQVVAGSYRVTRLSFEYADALDRFLNSIGVSDCRDLALPQVGSREDVIKKVEERLIYFQDDSGRQKRIAEMEALLKQLKEDKS